MKLLPLSLRGVTFLYVLRLFVSRYLGGFALLCFALAGSPGVSLGHGFGRFFHHLVRTSSPFLKLVWVGPFVKKQKLFDKFMSKSSQPRTCHMLTLLSQC